MSYSDLPEEVLKVIDEYSEKGKTASYLTSRNSLDDLPKDIQHVIAKYVAPVTYEDLVILAKLNKLNKLNEKKREVISMPWSEDKVKLAEEERLIPILIEAFLNETATLTTSQKYFLLGWAMANEKYQLATMIVNGMVISNRSFSQFLFQLINRFDKISSLLEESDLTDKKRRSLLRDLRSLHRQANFLVDNVNVKVPLEITDAYFNRLVGSLIDKQWFDILVKLGRRFKIADPRYLKVIVAHPELDKEFGKLTESLNEIDKNEANKLAAIIVGNSYDIARHLSILKKTNKRLLDAVLDQLK